MAGFFSFLRREHKKHVDMRGEEGWYISVLRCIYSIRLTNPSYPVIGTINRQPLHERGDEDALILGFSILSYLQHRRPPWNNRRTS